MAYIGLRHIVAARITEEKENALPTYDKGVLVGRGINADVTFDRADATLEADDTTVERDNSIIGGSITLGVDDVTDEARVALMGDVAVANSEGEYDEIGKAAPYCGVAYVRQRVFNGKTTFRAMYIPKCQFASSDDSAATKGRQTNFQTPTLTGAVMGVTLEDGEVHYRRRSKFFESAAEAIAWANSKVNYAEA